MNFIIRRRVKQMQNKTRVEPIVKAIRKPVLYPFEAHEFMKGCVPEPFPQYCIGDPNPLRVVKKKKSQDYYWLREYHGIQYAVKIGVNSEFFIAPKHPMVRVFEEIPMSMSLEFPLKDCFSQTKENTTLYVSVFYDADERKLSLQTLNLRGIDIKGFPHDYWNVQTLSYQGFGNDGCCGSVRYALASNEPEMDFGGLKIYDTIDLWTGSKTLKIFKKEDAGYTIKQMLDYWKNFWNVCGY